MFLFFKKKDFIFSSFSSFKKKGKQTDQIYKGGKKKDQKVKERGETSPRKMSLEKK